MKALVFKTSRTNIPGWSTDLYLALTHGYAYDLNSVYVSILGRGEPYQSWTYIEQGRSETLEGWCKDKFGGYDFLESAYEIGESIRSVWRPGIEAPEQLKAGLSYSDDDLSRSSQALRLLVSRLDEILMFIEPDPKYLDVYGHKTRDLLISACTEVENYFQYYVKLAGIKSKKGRHTVEDYVKLAPKLFLSEFEVEIFACPAIGRLVPFKEWSPEKVGLSWYRAYNKIKHNRDESFKEASLINCINAIGACLSLFSVKYGPVWWQPNFINSPIPDACRLFRRPAYAGDPCLVYVPKIKVPVGFSGWRSGTLELEPWAPISFSL